MSVASRSRSLALSARRILLTAFVVAAALAFATEARAGTVPVTVRVTSVTNFKWDPFSWPDLYARIHIDGNWSPLAPVRFDTQGFAPAPGSGWEFTAAAYRSATEA
jgi:hypothetical protein